MDANSVRDFIADKLEESQQWRTWKAEDYPDDLRNRTSAKALSAAAARVRGYQVDPPDPDLPEGMRSILRLARELDCNDPYADLPWGDEASRVAGRYGFTSELNFGEVPPAEMPEMIDLFTERIYRAMRADQVWIEESGEGDFESDEDDQSWDEQVLGVLRELRDLLNERLP